MGDFDAVLERVQEDQHSLGTTLRVEDFVLGGFCYRYGNFGRIGVEAVEEVFPRLVIGAAKTHTHSSENLLWGHAIPLPPQLPDPRSVFAGAGAAIGVALP